MWHFNIVTNTPKLGVTFILLQDNIPIKMMKLNPRTIKMIPRWFNVKLYSSQNCIITALNILVDFDDASFVINLHVPNMSILINLFVFPFSILWKEQQEICVFFLKLSKENQYKPDDILKKINIYFFHKQRWHLPLPLTPCESIQMCYYHIHPLQC